MWKAGCGRPKSTHAGEIMKSMGRCRLWKNSWAGISIAVTEDIWSIWPMFRVFRTAAPWSGGISCSSAGAGGMKIFLSREKYNAFVRAYMRYLQNGGISYV